MICVPQAALLEKAKGLPIAYIAECQEASTPNERGEWCFTMQQYNKIASKYAKYAVSEADPYRERISGCCDRADQY